jgi:hypothetical protein
VVVIRGGIGIAPDITGVIEHHVHDDIHVSLVGLTGQFL